MAAADGAANRSVAPELPAKAIRYGREYLVVLLAAGLLYGLTVAPGVLWQDNGLAQLRVLRHDLRGDLGLALSHPLYYGLAIGFQALPFAESALKTNLVSAVFGAVTVAGAYLLLRLLTSLRWAAVVGAASLAVAHTFWQHCTLAEVYAVSTALLVGELLCLTRYAQTGGRRWLVLLFLAAGLGVSNDMQAVLRLPIWGVLLIWLVARRRIGLGMLLGAIGAWLAGAALYLGLIASDVAAGQAVGDVIRSALFGARYAHSVLNWHLSGRLLGNSVLYLLLSFPTPLLALVPVGLLALRRLQPRPVAAAIGAALAIHLVWAVRYDVPDQYTFFIAAIVLLAITVGIGADRFLVAGRQRWQWWLLGLALLPAAVYVPLPWIAERAGLSLGVARDVPYRDRYTYFLWPWKTGYHGPERFAREVQQRLPPNAVLIADGTTVPPIHYLMETGRWYKAITVWPLLHGGDADYWPTPADVADALAAGRVYVVSPQPGYCPQWLLDGYEVEPVGVLYRVTAARPAPAPWGSD